MSTDIRKTTVQFIDGVDISKTAVTKEDTIELFFSMIGAIPNRCDDCVIHETISKDVSDPHENNPTNDDVLNNDKDIGENATKILETVLMISEKGMDQMDAENTRTVTTDSAMIVLNKGLVQFRNECVETIDNDQINIGVIHRHIKENQLAL